MKRYEVYIKRYWYHFLLGPLFMVLEASGEFILPYINALIIDQGALLKDAGYVIRHSLLMGSIAIAMLIAGVLGAYFSLSGAIRLSAGIREEVFAKVLTFSFREIDDLSTGSLITRMTNDITVIQNFLTLLLRGFFRSPVMLIGAQVMSYRLHRGLALVLFVIVLMLASGIALIVKIASPRYTKMQESIDTLNSHVDEMITNERVIKSFNRETQTINRFGIINHQLVERSLSALKMMIFLQPLSALAINACTLIVVYVAGKTIMIGGMAIGTLTAFITYLSQVLTSLNFLANIVLQGSRAYASHKRITAVLDMEVSLEDDGCNQKLQIEKGEISFTPVSFRYFKNHQQNVLDDIDLAIHAGETIGIVGTTGSGKSTLISLLPRLYDPDDGIIRIDGHQLTDYSLQALREGIGVVLQKNMLFSGTIAENLAWGNPDATFEEMQHACEVACADEFITGFPEGYEMMLSQEGNNLSGGQKQRLCIARTLLKKPKILILDDATSAVDMLTDAKIRNGLSTYLEGTTTLIIAQRIASIIDASRIIVLEHGRVVGFDKHENLLRSCQVYRDIYYSQNDREVMAHG